VVSTNVVGIDKSSVDSCSSNARNRHVVRPLCPNSSDWLFRITKQSYKPSYLKQHRSSAQGWSNMCPNNHGYVANSASTECI